MGQITNMGDTSKVEAVNPPDGDEIGWSIVKPKYLIPSVFEAFMCCIFVCHPHLTIISCCTAVWAQACGSEHKNKFCHYRASSVHLVSLTLSGSLLVYWWEQYHDTATPVTDYSDHNNLRCVCWSSRFCTTILFTFVFNSKRKIHTHGEPVGRKHV